VVCFRDQWSAVHDGVVRKSVGTYERPMLVRHSTTENRSAA
jgi:hypothetical protein